MDENHLTFLSMDENLEPFSVQMMHARKKSRGRGYAW